MMRRYWILWAGVWAVACGDDAATTTGQFTGGSTTNTSLTTLEPSSSIGDDVTSAGTGSATSDGSTDPGTDDASTEPGSSSGLDSSTGPGIECGNGIVEGDEVCDGDDLAGEDCASQGLLRGELSCLADCTGFDTSACTMASCGDAVAEGMELCDGDDLLGASCMSEGFDSGQLGCNGDCMSFDTAECGTCGNVIIDGDEACDGVALLGEDCLSQGFEYGEIACAADCSSFDTANCGLCGDDSVGGTEACDGPDLAGESCMSLGLGGGMLACLPSCAYDFSGCDIPGVPEIVDFPIAADPRFILSGTRPWNAGDWFEGMRMTGIPTTDQIDIHLEIPINSLSACGVQEAEVSINGVALGTFSVVQGTTAIDQTFPIVPSILGPNFTIRYETIMTVAPGCGSAAYGEVGSTVTFHPG